MLRLMFQIDLYNANNVKHTKHVQSAHISIPAEMCEFICIEHLPHARSLSFALNKLV